MYEEYMQNYLGYPRQSGYQNTYDQMLENYPYSQINYNGYPQYYNIQNRGGMTAENMEECYPEIYRIVYPMVRKVCAKNNRIINKDEIDSMVDEVYRNVEENDGVKKASQKLEEISQDEIMQRINDWKTMGEYNEEMGKRRAKEAGIKIGEAVGSQKKQKEIAKKLKEEKIPIEIIIKTTGLSKSEIEEL